MKNLELLAKMQKMQLAELGKTVAAHEKHEQTVQKRQDRALLPLSFTEQEIDKQQQKVANLLLQVKDLVAKSKTEFSVLQDSLSQSSHSWQEFSIPLGSTMDDIMEEQVVRVTENHLKNHLNKLEDVCNQLISAVQNSDVRFKDALSIIKIRHLNVQFQHRDFSFSDLLQKVTDSCEDTAKVHVVTFSISNNIEIPLSLAGSPQDLSSVLVTLISQAIESTDKGGLVTLETEVIKKMDFSITLRFKIKSTDEKLLSRIFHLHHVNEHAHASILNEGVEAVSKYGRKEFDRDVAADKIRFMNGHPYLDEINPITLKTEGNKSSTIEFEVGFLIPQNEKRPILPKYQRSASLIGAGEGAV